MSDCGQDREDIRAHLQMMQSVIARMADNSRACKTWAVTLAAAIFVAVSRFGTAQIADSNSGWEVFWLAVVPVLVFAFLDAYYLALEQFYRCEYRNFVKQFHDDKLKRREVFKMSNPQIGVCKTIHAMRSVTIWFMYSMMIAAIFAAHALG